MLHNRSSKIKRSLTQHKVAVTLGSFAAACVSVLYIIEKYDWFFNQTWKAAIASAASTLLAACFISSVFELYFRDKFFDVLDSQIKEALKNELALFNTSQRAGIRNVYTNLEEAMTKLDLYNKIPNEREIMILQTWAPTIDALKVPLKALHGNGGKAKVLCLKENCEVARIRSKFIDNFSWLDQDNNSELDAERYKSANIDIRRTKRAVIDIFGEGAIRQYDIFPTFSLYIIGNVVLMGHYLIYKNSFASMQIEVAKDSSYGAELLEYFDRLWSIAEEN